MTTAAIHNEHENTPEATLFVAFELSEKTWKLGFTTGHGQKPRERTVTARHHGLVLNEIAQAKRRLGLSETAPVVSCYEADREGVTQRANWLLSNCIRHFHPAFICTRTVLPTGTYWLVQLRLADQSPV
jgi:hypothetical protein